MRFWQIENATANTGAATLRIYGDIGSLWDSNTDAEIGAAVDAITAKELDVYINSYGGVADQGVAIYYILRRYAARGTLRTHNDGVVASAAVAPFLAGDARYAPPGTLLMIHNASTGAWGESDDLRSAADALEKLSASVAQLYAERTGGDLEQVKAMMAATTYMSPAEQLEHGYATDTAGAAVPAVMSGAALMCGGQAFDLAKLPGLPATMLATMLASKQPPAEQKDVKQAGQPGQKLEGSPMDMEKLKAEHPELHAAVMAAGADSERARIKQIQEAAPAGFEADAALAIEQKQSPAEFALAVLAKQKQAGANFLQQRKDDANAEGGANQAGGDDGKGDQQIKQEKKASILQQASTGFKQGAGVKN